MRAAGNFPPRWLRWVAILVNTVCFLVLLFIAIYSFIHQVRE